MSLLSKLPHYYLTNPAFLEIAKHIFASPIRFSGLFVARGKDLHLLLKDGSIYVKLDWEAFSLLRATSSLIVASGMLIITQGKFSGKNHWSSRAGKIMEMTMCANFMMLCEEIRSRRCFSSVERWGLRSCDHILTKKAMI